MSNFDMLENVRTHLTQKSFKGRTLIDGKVTGVQMEYIPPDEMRIKGLKPDLPPHVNLSPEIIEASENGAEWEKLELKTGLQILYILDPRILLTQGAYRVLDSYKTANVWNFTIECNLEILREAKKILIPDDLLKWMTEHGEKKRPVKLSITPVGTVAKMVQKELPPSRQELTVLFEY